VEAGRQYMERLGQVEMSQFVTFSPLPTFHPPGRGGGNLCTRDWFSKETQSDGIVWAFRRAQFATKLS